MADEEFKYDPEAKDSVKYRIPFALCKSRGIKIESWWTPRNAWDALKGQGVNPSKEYEEYYKSLKKEYAKKSYERAKQKRQQLNDELQNPTKNYTHIEGSIDGVQKSEPMNFEKADNGNCNPYYRKGIGYSHNCQTCVAVYLARRNGYDVYALPNLNNESIYKLSYNTSLAYIDNDTNKNPVRLQKERFERTDSFLEKNINEGEICTLQFSYIGKRSGHIIIAERDDKGVFLYDPQINKKYQGKEISQYLSTKVNIGIMKVSNCQIDESFADKIMKGVRK